MSQVDISRRFTSSDYKLLEKIGQGGFGSVFKATKLSTNQMVAIKLLNVSSDLDSDKRQRYIDRFHREASLSSLLQHENIVRLLDKGECDQGLIYAVFEYVQGCSLKELLLSSPLPPPVVASIMGQVLDAMAHAHERGVIHRDLKPENIMLTETSTGFHVKVLDFGIAALTHEARYQGYQTITLATEALGTPSYCAPEQLRGEPPTIKSDLYAWGLVFLECLTGEVTITGASLASIFHQQLSQSSISIPIGITGHPVAGLLRRVLNKRSKERPANAGELCLDLKMMNFHTLIGREVLKNTLKTRNRSKQLDDTRINNQGLIYSELTEKKQLAVLCITLNMHSAYDSGIDFEVAETIYKDHQIQCMDLAVSYGGFHAGTMGDTLLIYFGYPEVSDHDSRLCARTALDLVCRIKDINPSLESSHGITLSIQAGIHVGVVSQHGDISPDGESINFAMKIARLAKSQEILCSEYSRNTLENHARLLAVDEVVVGFNREIHKLYSILGERANHEYEFLMQSRSSSSYFGREIEQERLRESICSTEDRVLTHIYGEAGIGKSRLVYEFKSQNPNLHYATSQCLPEYRLKGLYPIISMIKSKFSLNSMTSEKAVSCLESVLALDDSINVEISMPILCDWLGFKIPTKYCFVENGIESYKQHLYKALTSLILKKLGSSGMTQVVLIEDIHWADVSTLDYLTYILTMLGLDNNDTRIITTSRKKCPIILKSKYIENIELTRLTAKYGERFVRDQFDSKNISQEVIGEVLTRADGVPFFIEELISMFKNNNFTRYLNGVIEFSSEKPVCRIPDTLTETLQGKLNNLVHSKDTAQLMAVIGREIEVDVLYRTSHKIEEQINSDLKELVESEVIYQPRQMDRRRFIFRHSLVREAVYSSIPKRICVAYHQQVARNLVCTESDLSLNAMVFEHLRKGLLFEEAISIAISSIRAMLSMGDFNSAVHMGVESRKCFEKIDRERSNLKLKLNCFLMSAYVAIGGNGSDEVLMLANENSEICLNLDVDYSSDLVLVKYLHQSAWALMTHCHMHSQREIALSLALKEVKVCRKFNANIDSKIVAVTQAANCLMMDDRLYESQELLIEALDYNSVNFDSEFTDISCNDYGFSSRSFPYMIASIVWSLLGDEKKGREYSIKSIQISELVNSPVTIMIAIGYGVILAYLIKDYCLMEELLAKANSLLESQSNLDHFSIYIRMPEAYLAEDADLFKKNINLLEATGQTQWLSVYKCMQIEILLNLNRSREAEVLLVDTIEWVEKIGERVCLSNLLALRSRVRSYVEVERVS